MAKKEIAKKPTTAAKTPASKTAVKTSKPAAKETVSTPKVSGKSLKVKKSYVFLVAGIVLVAALLYFFRGLFVAAVVNGQPVSRWSIIKEAEKQSGKQALNNVVRNIVIEQEARKQNVTVSDKEINEEIKKVEDSLSKQGQKLDQVLSLQGMTRDDLKKLVRLDKLVGKMVGKDIKVTDEEIAQYMEQNKELLPQDQSEEQLKKTVAEQIKQQKMNEKVRTWLSDLQGKAKILYFVQY